MSKSKRGPALFELLAEEKGKGANPLGIPGWWGHSHGAGKVDAGPTAPEEVSSLMRPASAHLRPTSGGTSAGAGGAGVPLVELDADRIRISLTSVAAAVAVFAGAVVALAVFELGRWRGDRAGFERGYTAGRASYAADAMSEIEAARSQPPATGLVSSLLRESDTIPGPGEAAADEGVAVSEQPTWIRGYAYIVAQEFSADHLDNARKAQEFLSRHGVATELIQYPSGALQLITTQGYSLDDPVQRTMADQLKKKVHDIGAQYYTAGGGYKLEGYFKTFKGDRW